MDPRKKWSETMSYVAKLNETHGVEQKGKKKYTQVVHRMEALREHHGLDIGVSTEILVDDGARVVMQAIIHTNDAPSITLGMGHAEELRGQGLVNKTSAIENCETSAIGRALASIGLSGGEYASANEMDGVERKTEAKSNPVDKLPQQKDTKTQEQFAKQACQEIHAMTKIGELHLWTTKNEKKLESLAAFSQPLVMMVTNALDEKSKKLSEPEMPVAETHGTEPDPTPAPQPENPDEKIPF